MTEQKKYQDVPSFLLGESMGGAIDLNIHFKQPAAWNGAALIAPLCKVYLLVFKLTRIFLLLNPYVCTLTGFLE